MNIKGKYEKYDENCKKVLKSCQKNCKSGKNLKKKMKEGFKKVARNGNSCKKL